MHTFISGLNNVWLSGFPDLSKTTQYTSVNQIPNLHILAKLFQHIEINMTAKWAGNSKTI